MLSGATSKQRATKGNKINRSADNFCVTSKQRAIENNKNNHNNDNPKSTQKCCRMYGTPTSELMNFLNIVMHKRMHDYNLNYNGSPYVLVIIWKMDSSQMFLLIK